MIPRLKASEKVESFMMNRPNEKLDAHLEQYIRAAALGLGLPYEFIWDTSAVGGVAQRFIIQKAARAFAARQDVLISSFLGKLWSYAIANAMKRRELPLNANWRKVEWQTPRSITVDVGREATARRDDVKAGLMTLADFFGEQGLDWKEALNEIAGEREYARELGVVVGQERPPVIPVPMPDPSVRPGLPPSPMFAQLDCGTGAGGFKPGNDCAGKGGGAAKSKKPSIYRTDKIDDATGLPLNSDGTVTVYHHTSQESADQIEATGVLKSAGEPDVYVTTEKATTTGYGDVAVAINVSPESLELDDEFPGGRKDFRINAGKPGGSIKVNVGEPAISKEMQSEESTTELSAPEGFNQLDCGTGAGGFKPGNDCAKGAGSKKKDNRRIN
jgi:hypothetical protein